MQEISARLLMSLRERGSQITPGASACREELPFPMIWTASRRPQSACRDSLGFPCSGTWPAWQGSRLPTFGSIVDSVPSRRDSEARLIFSAHTSVVLILYGFVSLSTQLLLILCIFWSSPLLSHHRLPTATMMKHSGTGGLPPGHPVIIITGIMMHCSSHGVRGVPPPPGHWIE